MDPSERQAFTEHDAYGLVGEFSETARIVFAAGGVTDTLAQVVQSAVVTIEGCDLAGLSLADGPAPTLSARTDELVEEIEALQLLNAEGPGLDAIAENRIVSADDIAHDPRWPRFGPSANAIGVHSVLALPLTASAVPGTLVLYSRSVAAFDATDRAKATILASLAGLATAAARSHQAEEERFEGLHAALATREVIGQAQGILMERERISADEAFNTLRRASQHLNRKLRDVAQDLVDTGEKPESGSSSR